VAGSTSTPTSGGVTDVKTLDPNAPANFTQGGAYYLNQFPSWEYWTLLALRAPTSITNLQALNLWARSEGVPAKQNNPLALGDSVKTEGNQPTYPTPKAAGSAIAAQLLNGDASFGYGKIVAALRSPDSTLEDIWRAVNESKWCNGCQAGTYPTALYAARGQSPWSIPIGNTQGVDVGIGSNPDYTGCDSNHSILQLPGVFGNVTVLNQCQAKAIIGGLLAGVGVAIFFGGVALIIANAGDGSVTKQVVKGVGDAVTKPATAVRDGLNAITDSVANRRMRADDAARQRYARNQAYEASRRPAPTPPKSERDQQVEDIERRASTMRPRAVYRQTPSAPAKKPATPVQARPETRVPRKEKKLRAKP